MGAYDTRITEGWIGVTVTTSENRIGKAEEILRKSGAREVKRGWEKS
jgi:hypothetical protein